MTATEIASTTPDATTALVGPWQAVLSDLDGFVYPSVQDAIETLGEDTEIEIAVVRDTAAPNDRDGTTGALQRRLGSHLSGDIAYEILAYLIDPDDASIGAHARYEQAKAMASGLNTAARAAAAD